MENYIIFYYLFYSQQTEEKLVELPFCVFNRNQIGLL